MGHNLQRHKLERDTSYRMGHNIERHDYGYPYHREVRSGHSFVFASYVGYVPF